MLYLAQPERGRSTKYQLGWKEQTVSSQPSVRRQYVGLAVSGLWLIVCFSAIMAFIILVVAPATDKNQWAIFAAAVLTVSLVYVPVQILLIKYVGGRKEPISDWPV